MSTWVRVFVAVMLVLIADMQTSWAQDCPATIEIQVATNVVKSGDSIVLNFTLTNISPASLTINHQLTFTTAQVNYNIEVRQPNGNVAALTQYGQEFYGDKSSDKIATGGSITSTELKSNDELRQTAPLSDLFDMISPGTYNVQATRYIMSNSGICKMTSNIISVHVTN